MRKSDLVKTAVLSLAAAGKSNRRIAQELGIHRRTVSRVLTEPEIAAVIQRGKNDVVRMVPKAVGVVDDALDKDNTGIATSVLTGVGVLKSEANGGSARVTLNIVMDPRPRPVEIPTIPRRDQTITLAEEARPDRRGVSLSELAD